MTLTKRQILQYEREKKKSHFELKIYAIVEALVFFLDSSYDGRWMSKSPLKPTFL